MKLVDKLDKQITLKDPVHGSIKINYTIIKTLIDTREFQRLRRIRQLGFTYTVFHTATHDRFSHSLGAYELTRRLLFENDSFTHLSENEKLYTLIASLLHDIGHGPFSHTFELVFDFNHEKMGSKIILGSSEVNRILKECDENLPRIIADIIAKKYDNKLLTNIISSDVDVDRMDYLIRDSYFTSTTLGVYDQFQLIRNMQIIGSDVVINEKAINSLESFFIARHHMFRQVYTHTVSESFEVQAIWFFERLQKLYDQGYQFSFNYDILKPFLNQNFSVNDFIMLDDSDILVVFKNAQNDKDLILSKCAGNIVNRKKCNIKTGFIEDLQNDFTDQRTLSSRTEILRRSTTSINIKVLMKNGELKDAIDTSPILKGLISDVGSDDELIIYYI